MNEIQARMFREAHDAYVKRISRMTRAQLFELERADQAEHGVEHIFGGPHSKDELIRSLVELHYPAGQMNEAGHVLWHADAPHSACQMCHPRHGDLNCDCGLVSLHALCVCGHPRHKHWRDGSEQGAGCDDTAIGDAPVRCRCKGYVIVGQPSRVPSGTGWPA